MARGWRGLRARIFADPNMQNCAIRVLLQSCDDQLNLLYHS
jgi:hypothetical protein